MTDLRTRGSVAGDLKATETLNLIAADKVEGTAVYNPAGDKLGTVENLMIDKHNGRVSYAVMSFGGFLGMGESRHPLPWDTLKYDTNMGGYVVNMDTEMLRRAPTYEEAQGANWEDRDWNRRVHDYYGVAPYWM
jgi:sporulation protein YlmC with PRC-barrel domain